MGIDSNPPTAADAAQPGEGPGHRGGKHSAGLMANEFLLKMKGEEADLIVAEICKEEPPPRRAQTDPLGTLTRIMI